MNSPKDRVILKKNVKRRIANGHPWIYSNEIFREPVCPDDSIVDVFNYSNQFIGKGFYNKKSKIRVRLVTRKYERIDVDFFKKRIEKAWTIRKKYLSTDKQNAMRIIYSDTDYLPGLIIDKYGDYLVLQFNIEGIKNYKDAIVEIVERFFSPKGIFQNSLRRTDEENSADNGWISGKDVELIPFEIDGLTYFADTLGQGTGFYLDQRDNAEQLAKYAREKSVLDLFSYTGNFAIRMLKQGASNAILVDSSKRALEVAREACKYNKVIDKTTFINENVFEYIKNENIKEELIVLDPPPLGKTSKNKSIIMNGYNELNIRAINALPNDGILGTTCRFYNVKWSSWNKNINMAFIDTNSAGRLLYMGGQSIDFAPLNCIYETSYLKFNIYKIERF